MGNIISNKDLKWGFPFLAPNGSAPSTYLLQVALDHEIGPGILFHDCLVEFAKCHRQHAEGDTYNCYGCWIGKGVVNLYYPKQSIEQINICSNNEKVITDVLGEEKGKKLLSDFKSTIITDDMTTLQYLPNFSNLLEMSNDTTPFEYIYRIVAKQKDSSNVIEFKNMIQEIILLTKQKIPKLNWVTYVDMNSNDLHIFAPMRSFGEMDDWSSIADFLRKQKIPGFDSISQILYSSLIEYKTDLLTFVPSCDNSGCEFIE